MRIRNILVPIDFSPPSKLAADYGIALARTFRSGLTFLHVVEFPALSVSPHETENAELKLSQLAGSEDEDDLNIRTVVKVGDVQDSILETVREEAADLVVMGTHGRGFLGRVLVGSVTQHLLRKVGVPVFTVCHAHGPLTFSKILFATDLSDASAGAFRTALELAKSHGSHLTMLHAVDYPGINYGAIGSDVTAERELFALATERLRDMAALAEQEGLDVETRSVRGPAAEQILAAARDDADLILLSIERKGFLEKAFLGSTAEHVVRDAHVPVLSIPVEVEIGRVPKVA
jgi:nucleotide-binding universal stress UspA family protein